MPEIKNLIIGSGFSGAVIARKIAEELGEKVVILEQREHIGGNSYDFKDKNGIMIHKYGSHIFHTNYKDVWDFLNKFTSFNTYMHKVIAIIDGIQTYIPFNLSSIYDVFPSSLAARLENKLLENFSYNTKVPILEFMKQNDEDLKFLAEYIYEKVFLHYTIKQWGGVTPSDIDSAVTARVPVYISCDNRYFQDKYQGIPLEGYTKLIKNIINHPNIELRLNTKFQDFKETYENLFYTGSIDEFFEYKYGMLSYRSINFKFEEYDREYYQRGAVVNYPCNYDFTRIHEYKHYLDDKSEKTVIAKEYSSDFEPGKNERFYPILNAENIELYNKYKKETEKLKNIYFFGRLGDYKYYDIDKVVKRAFDVFENFKLNHNSIM